jgi:hypothetical protein
MDEEEDRIWWEEAWTEREDLLCAFYGPSHPPGSPEGYVCAFPGGAIRLRIPGGCAYAFRPRIGGPPGAREDAWLFVSHGITQPLDRDEVRAARREGSDRSSYGWEFAIELAEPAGWVKMLLANICYYARDPESPTLGPGHRMPFFLHETEDGVQESFGFPDGEAVVGTARALLFWPDLRTERDFECSTGSFGVLVGTAVTEDEYALAKATSTMHVLALLKVAGIGQRTDPMRPSVAADPAWRAEWGRIRKLDGDALMDILYGA